MAKVSFEDVFGDINNLKIQELIDRIIKGNYDEKIQKLHKDKNNEPIWVICAIAYWCYGRDEDKLKELVDHISKIKGCDPTSVKSSWSLFVMGPAKKNSDGQRKMPILSANYDKTRTLKEFVEYLNNKADVPWGNNTINNKKNEKPCDIAIKYKKRFIEILDPNCVIESANIPVSVYTQRMDEIECEEIFAYSRCVIFFGPPGTGKTRKAKIDAVRLVTGKSDMDDAEALSLATEIISGRNEDDSEAGADSKKYKEYFGRICLVQFHPSYSYNDFIETIDMTKLAVNKKGESSGFEDKIFKRFATRAREAADEFLKGENKKQERNGDTPIDESEVIEDTSIRDIESTGENNQTEVPKSVLIIDEINRANVSEVLGELLYGLEYREAEITTGISNTRFSIPENLYIIGTMNTADRSLQNLDYAVRRRFSFVEVRSKDPQAKNEEEKTNDYYLIQGEKNKKGVDDNKYFMKKAFDQVKQDIEESVARGIDPKDIMPGISYFIVNSKDDNRYDEEHFEFKIKYELIPLLQEYIKDGMFTKRKMLDTESKKTLIDLIKDKEYYNRLIKLFKEKNN